MVDVRDDGLARTARRCLQVLVIAVAVGVAFWAMSHVLVVVVPLFLAVCLTSVLWPAVGWLRARRWPRAAATAVVSLGSLLLLGGVVAAAAPATVNGIDDLSDSVGRAIESVQGVLARAGLEPAQVRGAFDMLREQLTRGDTVDRAVTGLVIAVEVLAGIALTLVLTVYLLHSGDRLARGLAGLVPASRREPLRRVAGTTWSVLGTYVRGTAVVGLVDAASMAVGLLLLGVPLVVPLAVLTFFGAFLPFVGALLTGALAAAVALVAQGPWTALAVVGLAVLVQQIEGDVVQPRVFSRRLDLHPVIVICAIAAGAAVGGIVGAFVAVPIAAVALALLRERADEPAAVPGGG